VTQWPGVVRAHRVAVVLSTSGLQKMTQKGHTMRRKLEILLIAVSLTMLWGLMSSTAAMEEEGTCYLKATTDVYMEVYDYDEDDNRTGFLWKGRLNEGKSIKIKAPRGRLSFDFNDLPDQDRPLSSADEVMCTDDRTVSVP
jgi:hypothetical protein